MFKGAEVVAISGKWKIARDEKAAQTAARDRLRSTLTHELSKRQTSLGIAMQELSQLDLKRTELNTTIEILSYDIEAHVALLDSIKEEGG